MRTENDVYRTLKDRLVRGGFGHGAKLRPSFLSEEYGCSASALREVLLRLSAEGLVVVRQQRGFWVPELDRVLQRELAELRILLESEGASRSIERGGIRWEARLSAAHHQLSHIETRIREANDTSAYLDVWVEAEQEFHETLISACGSESLKATHAAVYARFRQQLIVSDQNFGHVSENIKQHQTILDAALDGDEARLRLAIHAHLERNLVLPPEGPDAP